VGSDEHRNKAERIAIILNPQNTPQLSLVNGKTGVLSFLRQEFLDDRSGNIGQAEVASLKTIGELSVVNPH
jgi:hypothetical protein